MLHLVSCPSFGRSVQVQQVPGKQFVKQVVGPSCCLVTVADLDQLQRVGCSHDQGMGWDRHRFLGAVLIAAPKGSREGERIPPPGCRQATGRSQSLITRNGCFLVLMYAVPLLLKQQT